MKHPIPDAALDDRLGFVGTAGSGKTYNAGGRVERLLDKSARVVIVDPLGVWWGLRLLADGKTQSPYDVVIFGGVHGDLPLTEHAGVLIGETVAGMAESCIIDLSGLGTKNSERRFMLAFLTALYRHTNSEPVHLVLDEADMWAPQRLLDKEGDAAKLLGMMETIVRRGRIKGFVPWLISQRPAVISKDILSQVDGLVAFKLTSSQDRDAIGDWVEGQADKAQWRELWAQLPTLQRGQGLVWVPGRGILTTEQFPEKHTFDSSRAPKRGEKAQRSAPLKPLDLGALKERLASVEAEVKGSDPKALKAEIARLKQQMAEAARQAARRGQASDPEALAKAEERGFEQAKKEFGTLAERVLQENKATFLQKISSAIQPLVQIVEEELRAARIKPQLKAQVSFTPSALPRWTPAARPPATASRPQRTNGSALSAPLQKVVDAIAWWQKVGIVPVERARASVVAGFSPKASTFGVYIAELVKQGLVDVSPGRVALTSMGLSVANMPTAATAAELWDMARGLLSAQEAKVFDAIYEVYPNSIRRDAVAEVVGLSPSASTCGVYIAGVAAYGIIEPAGRGEVKAADWLFP